MDSFPTCAHTVGAEAYTNRVAESKIFALPQLNSGSSASTVGTLIRRARGEPKDLPLHPVRESPPGCIDDGSFTLAGR